MAVINIFKKLSIGFLAIAYGPQFLMPISYLCFGVPSRHDWILPIQSKWGSVYNDSRLQLHSLNGIFFIQIIYRELLDKETFCGFYILWTNLFIGGIFYFIFLTVSLGFYITLCAYTHACLEDFKDIFTRFNQGTSNKQHTYPIISEAVQLHSDMFKLFKSHRIFEFQWNANNFHLQIQFSNLQFDE